MMEFTMEGFAKHLEKLAADMPLLKLEMLRYAGAFVEQVAKGKIGEYQEQAGPFAAWEPLADTTLSGWDSPWGRHFPGKIELGYSPDDNPLLRTGELRESIHHLVEGEMVQIGSDMDIAVWQELGTSKMPARSFLGGAMFESAPLIVAEFEKKLGNYIAGMKAVR